MEELLSRLSGGSENAVSLVSAQASFKRASGWQGLRQVVRELKNSSQETLLTRLNSCVRSHFGVIMRRFTYYR